jgi:hypothetical protein
MSREMSNVICIHQNQRFHWNVKLLLVYGAATFVCELFLCVCFRFCCWGGGNMTFPDCWYNWGSKTYIFVVWIVFEQTSQQLICSSESVDWWKDDVVVHAPDQFRVFTIPYVHRSWRDKLVLLSCQAQARDLRWLTEDLCGEDAMLLISFVFDVYLYVFSIV